MHLSLDEVKTAAGLACATVTAASAFCAATPTPPPNTVLGRVYRVVETLALLVGKAKQMGLVADSSPVSTPPAPQKGQPS